MNLIEFYEKIINYSGYLIEEDYIVNKKGEKLKLSLNNKKYTVVLPTKEDIQEDEIVFNPLNEPPLKDVSKDPIFQLLPKLLLNRALVDYRFVLEKLIERVIDVETTLRELPEKDYRWILEEFVHEKKEPTKNIFLSLDKIFKHLKPKTKKEKAFVVFNITKHSPIQAECCYSFIPLKEEFSHLEDPYHLKLPKRDVKFLSEVFNKTLPDRIVETSKSKAPSFVSILLCHEAFCDFIDGFVWQRVRSDSDPKHIEKPIFIKKNFKTTKEFVAFVHSLIEEAKSFAKETPKKIVITKTHQPKKETPKKEIKEKLLITERENVEVVDPREFYFRRKPKQKEQIRKIPIISFDEEPEDLFSSQTPKKSISLIDIIRD